ncbi:MAG: hypothetical protein H7305_12695 [Gemmatimonadaceae bacterium]|nr:hypothetical protein [Gemmatimonadaceae bacterium]
MPHARALAACAAGARALHAGKSAQALTQFASAAALAPHAADVAAMHGVALRGAGRMQDAQRELIRAIGLDQHRADSYTQLAQTYCLINDHAQAANAFLASATLQITNAVAWRDTAESMRRSHRLADGLQIARHAFALAPTDASIANVLALLLHRNDRIDEAMSVCERVRAVRPDDANLALTHAMLLRTCEQYDQGWLLHEHRLSRPELTMRPNLPASPRWNGAPLHGAHILVCGEQGLGDQVQFARWVPALRDAGAGHVTLHCAPALVRLLNGVRGVDAVVASSTPAPAHDVHVDIMSLPHLLLAGCDMRRDMVPYIALPPAHDALAARLHRTRPGALRLGLVWGGTPLHTEDRSRSMALATLLPALVRPDVETVVLQQGASRDQLDTIDPVLRQTFVDIAPHCSDMTDTAQAVQQCDVLLSVDTSVAHVAGALGIPTWVMVSCPAEWRWGRGRDDSLFYPSVRVLRQGAVGDWSAVVRQITQQVDAWHAQARRVALA